MSGNVTFQELIDDAKDRADMVGSTFVSDAQWLKYINKSKDKLKAILKNIDHGITASKNDLIALKQNKERLEYLLVAIEDETVAPEIIFNISILPPYYQRNTRWLVHIKIKRRFNW